MIRIFRRLGLQKRIMIYVIAGLVALFGLFAYLALLALHQSTDLVFEERLTMAKTVASNLDANIRHVQRELEQYSALVSLELEGGAEELVLDHLNELSKHLKIEDNVRISTFIGFADGSGTMLLTEPHSPQVVGTKNYSNAAIEKARQTGTLAIMANDDLSANHEPSVSLATPVMGEGDALLGFLTVDCVPNLNALGFAPIFHESEREYELEVITDKGVVVISSSSEEPLGVTHHLELLSPLVEDQRAGVLEHHASGEGEQDHIVAYAPLTTVPWGVTLEQPKDRAFVLISSMERRMIILGGLGLVLALTVAWFTTRQVVRPLSRLTVGSQQIASGNLGNPIPTLGADEVRTLAQSFETMRVKLKNAYDERLQWEKELESRVRDRTEEVRQLLHKIVSAQEEERKRLSRELHDDTAQTLATLLITLQTIHDTLGSREEKGKELSASALSQASQAMSDIRRIMLDLRPSALDDLGFIYALRSYAEDRLTPLRVTIELEVIGEERRLDASVETALFRILQEAVNNIAKHAQAEMVRLRLEFQSEKFIATVEDDGRGFDLEGVLVSNLDNRLGLKGMQERASLIGATLSFSSRPGIGTTIRVEVPLT